MKDETPEIKVSVCVVCYNQENYISQCLQSIVDQKTAFKFEVIVSDDCSKDRTPEIIQRFAQNYSYIKPVLRKKNIGAYQNFIQTHELATGKYVCHIDGDDYCLPGKLQKQSDFLDQNIHCNIVWHRMNILTKDQNFFEDNYSQLIITGKRFSLEDLLCNITIGLHSSKMYRRSCLSNYKNLEIIMLDFSANIFQLNEKDKYAAFVNDSPYGVYRSNNGISTQHLFIRKALYQWFLYFYRIKITDRSLINAKIFWMLLSDIRHKKKSMYFGLYAFCHTINSLNFSKIRSVRSKMIPQNMFYRQINEEK